MKTNFLISIICAILLGYLSATFIFKEYRDSNSVFGASNTIYFLQYGVYTKPNSSNLKDTKYIEVKEDGKYYVYIGMTTNLENAEKIKKIYQDNKKELYIKESYINNNEFVSELSQYDVLLDSSKTKEEVNSILSTILSTYEELVLKR